MRPPFSGIDFHRAGDTNGKHTFLGISQHDIRLGCFKGERVIDPAGTIRIDTKQYHPIIHTDFFAITGPVVAGRDNGGIATLDFGKVTMGNQVLGLVGDSRGLVSPKIEPVHITMGEPQRPMVDMICFFGLLDGAQEETNVSHFFRWDRQQARSPVEAPHWSGIRQKVCRQFQFAPRPWSMLP